MSELLPASRSTGRHGMAGRTAGRADAIDFWRGIVLCTIFVNHVPGNLFERLTFKNYGFSDSSEAFVFISGVALALAYGGRVLAGTNGLVMTGLARRAVKLYAVHIGLSLVGVAVFALGALAISDPDLMQQHGRDLLLDDPGSALLGLLSMGHQFGYFNILPLYVVLVAMAPALFWLARIDVSIMLAASFAVYAAARLSHLNIPSWPMRGVWFFDPFTWQFMLAIGIAAGMAMRSGHLFAPRRALTLLAVVIVVASAVVATDALGLCPGLDDAVRNWADVDKTMLGLGRIVHFVALGYLLWAFRIAARLRDASFYNPMCLLGRHGLPVFVALSLLAATGQVVTARFGHPMLLDIIVIGGGLAALLAFAAVLAARRQHEGLARASLVGHR